MPQLLAALIGGLMGAAGSIAGRVLLSLGFSLITYTGVSLTLGWLKTQAISSFTSLPPSVVGMLATLKVGESISIIFSAILVRLALNGLTSDTLKRLVQK